MATNPIDISRQKNAQLSLNGVFPVEKKQVLSDSNPGLLPFEGQSLPTDQVCRRRKALSVHCELNLN